MEWKHRACSAKRRADILPAVVFSIYVSLQAPGGFLHASVYPINLFVWKPQAGRGGLEPHRASRNKFLYNPHRKELTHAESGECSANRTNS